MAADAVAEAVEPATEEHPHEHQVHRAEAAEVAGGVRLVGAAALEVGHPAVADHHLADVGLGAGLDALGVEGAGGYVALGTTRRRVGHVLDGQAVARVEEARRTSGGQRQAVDPGAHARHRVAAVLEDLGDAP